MYAHIYNNSEVFTLQGAGCLWRSYVVRQIILCGFCLGVKDLWRIYAVMQIVCLCGCCLGVKGMYTVLGCLFVVIVILIKHIHNLQAKRPTQLALTVT